eukprot:gene15436-13360_t
MPVQFADDDGGQKRNARHRGNGGPRLNANNRQGRAGQYANATQRAPAPNKNRMATMKAGATMMRAKAGNATKGVGKWLGLGMDNHQHNQMATMYAQRKRQQATGRAPRATAFGNPLGGIKRKSVWNKKMGNREAMKFSRDLKEAILIYRQVRDDEKAKQLKPGWFGGEQNRRRDSVTDVYHAPKRRHSNIRDDTLVALQLEALPTFYPWFTYIMTTIQVLVFIGMMTHVYTAEKFAKFHLIPKEVPCAEHPGSCPFDFLGNEISNYTVTEEVNWAFGPDSHYLLQVGAKWSNCMRYSEEAKIEAAVTRIKDQCVIGQKLLPVQLQPEGDAVLKAQELEDIEEAKTAVGYGCGNTAECPDCELGIVKSFEDGGTRGMGCCETYQRHKAGMTTYQECRDWFIADLELDCIASPDMSNAALQLLDDEKAANLADFPIGTLNNQKRSWWEEGSNCMFDAAGNDRGTKNNIFLRPCCGIRMETENFCEILTESMCTAREGQWQNDATSPKILCSDVTCQPRVCALRSELTDKIDIFDVTADNPYTWWRLILPLFIHAGAIQLVLNMIVQYYC